MGSKVQEPTTAGGCAPCSPARRNRYFRGKRMLIADYELEQAYHIGRRRLVNRAMLGWGVIEGFAIKDLDHGITVGAGIALDPCGRELVACEATRLCDCHDVLWLAPSGDACCEFKVGDPPNRPVRAKDAKGGDEAQGGDGAQGQDETNGLWLLSAHYAERRLDGVVIDDGCETRCEPNNLCETVVYSLRPLECCEAGLPDCRCPGCAGEDRCACEEPCPFSLDRGNQRQLVQWSLDLRDRADPCENRRLSANGCIALDPCAGVPLACVTIAFDCGEPFIKEVIDAAHPRRLARRNEDLFDLIRGCDLTRIAKVGWSGWLAPDKRRVAFSHFAAMFNDPVYPPGSQYVEVTTGLTVEFTAPVSTACLTPDALAITLISREQRESVGDMVRVPVVRLEPNPQMTSDPDGTTRGFAVRVSSRFWEGELDRRTSSAFERPTIVEIEIRTDFIDDCNGQQVAGGGRYVPSNGCVPGGRFLSSFIVIPDSWSDVDDPGGAGKMTKEEA